MIREEIMREMAKFAVEQATEMFARQAEEAAKILPPNVDGKAALLAFAKAIRSTNSQTFPATGGAS